MSPNPNYARGRRLEWAFKKHLEASGDVVLRSAGSHGFADLTAVRSGGGVTFYQLKVVRTKGEATNLIKHFRAAPPLQPSSHYHLALVVKIHGQSTYEQAFV